MASDNLEWTFWQSDTIYFILSISICQVHHSIFRFDIDPIQTLTKVNQRADFAEQLISERDAYFQKSFITAVVSGHAEEIKICSRELLLDASMKTQL